MAKNRKAAELYIIKYIEKLTPGTNNGDIYRNFFKNMSDKDFDEFMTGLEDGSKRLAVIVPNGKKSLTIENNLELAKELKHDFFSRLWIGEQDGRPAYLTPVKYMVVDLPVRRASQTLHKKRSIPDHNKVIDALTGQPTGESKGAKISYPELQLCAGMGLDKTMVELMKFRGGDEKGFAAMNGMLSQLGTANLQTLNNYSSGVESTKTLKTFLTCMMLKNTL